MMMMMMMMMMTMLMMNAQICNIDASITCICKVSQICAKFCYDFAMDMKMN
jgi:hypothetical protein